MVEGLFGQVFPWVFEILPFLYEHQIFPEWRIQAAHYGKASDGVLLPGAFDLAYDLIPKARKDVNLLRLRDRHRHVLGNDWQGLSELWHAYFRVPDRIIDQAATVGPLEDAIGIHYRGNDKQGALWDTNPVSHQQYLAIVRQFCRERPEFHRIFLSTDDASFCDYLQSNLSVEVINLGGIAFHKAKESPQQREIKTDRAILDCVLLSRCGVVLQTSSALPSFAKVINPDLEIYRVAASKLFSTAPYFPVAYIPIYDSSSREIADLVDRLTIGDWTKTDYAHMFTEPFVSRPHGSPMIRSIYSRVRRLFPGWKWIDSLPNLLMEHRRRWALRMQKR